MIQLLRRAIWRLLKQLGIKLPYDPVIPLLGVCTEKIINEKGTCTPVFIAELFTLAWTWKHLDVL